MPENPVITPWNPINTHRDQWKYEINPQTKKRLHTEIYFIEMEENEANLFQSMKAIENSLLY